MTDKKCFELWADNVFLGYEYGVTQADVLKTARQKHGKPTKWSVIEYKTTQLTPENPNG